LLAVGSVVEEVGGALEGVAVDDWMGCADEHGARAEGEGGTEEVVGRAVARREGVELAPRTAFAKEDVDLALRGVAIDGRDIGRDDGFAVVQREGVAEVKERSGIARGQLLGLTPGAAGVGVNINRALSKGATDDRLRRADEDGRAMECDGKAEV